MHSYVIPAKPHKGSSSPAVVSGGSNMNVLKAMMDPGSPHDWQPGPPDVWRAGLRHAGMTAIVAVTGMTTWCLGASPTKPVERKTLIIAIGDSTTAGTPYARSPLEDPPNGSGDATRQASDRSVSDPE